MLDVGDRHDCEMPWIWESWVDILANVRELEIDLVVDFLHDGQDQVAESVL